MIFSALGELISSFMLLQGNIVFAFHEGTGSCPVLKKKCCCSGIHFHVSCGIFEFSERLTPDDCVTSIIIGLTCELIVVSYLRFSYTGLLSFD